MASTEHYRQAASPPFLALAIADLLGSLRKLSQALKNRRAAWTLAGMDERMLRDIGLSRSDLRDAYAEPLWRDPTDILAARVRDRRRSRAAPDAKDFFASPPLVPPDGFSVPDTNRPSQYTL